MGWISSPPEVKNAISRRHYETQTATLTDRSRQEMDSIAESLKANYEAFRSGDVGERRYSRSIQKRVKGVKSVDDHTKTVVRDALEFKIKFYEREAERRHSKDLSQSYLLEIVEMKKALEAIDHAETNR